MDGSAPMDHGEYFSDESTETTGIAATYMSNPSRFEELVEKDIVCDGKNQHLY